MSYLFTVKFLSTLQVEFYRAIFRFIFAQHNAKKKLKFNSIV